MCVPRRASDVGAAQQPRAQYITLRWMLRKAVASGLPMVPDALAPRVRAPTSTADRRQLDLIRNRARSPRPMTLSLHGGDATEARESRTPA